MHVHLDQLRVADHQDRVAQLLDRLADPVDVQLVAVDEELGAVAPALLREVQRRLHREPGRRPPGELRLDLLDRPQHALEHDLEAVAARVHDARLAEDLELRGRPLDGAPRARRRGLDDADGRGPGLLGRPGGAPAGLPGHGQDRALGGLLHRPVGLLERLGELGGRQDGLVADRVREAAEDLRQDHAGVAPCPHQAAVRGQLADVADVVGLRLADVPDRRFQRQQHVRARVAVGHGEHVEPVDLLLVGAEPREAAQQGLLQQLAVDGVGASPL